eukprot:5275873-Amphidinium_carterae.1
MSEKPQKPGLSPQALVALEMRCVPGLATGNGHLSLLGKFCWRNQMLWQHYLFRQAWGAMPQ